jgi:hypothetical protein
MSHGSRKETVRVMSRFRDKDRGLGRVVIGDGKDGIEAG